MVSRANNPRTRGKPPTRIKPGRKPSAKNKPPKAARIKNQEDVVRGKEVTVRDSSDEAQIVYGQMQIGGNVTYIEVSADAAAYLQIGSESDSNELVFTARTPGDPGNDITIAIVVPAGDNPTTQVAVSGNAITITIARSGGFSQTRLNNLIAAVEGNSAANALVSVRKRVAGANGFITEAMDPTPLSYGGGTWLHQYITLTGHEIQAVEKLILDGREVTFGASPDPRWGTGVWANRVFMAVQYGSADQTPQADLMGQMPAKWTSNHRQRGWAGVYLILVQDPNVFPEGIPAATFQILGKKVYDPRTGTIGYSNNAALVIADFLMDQEFGFGVPLERIDLTTWQAAATVCDTPGLEYKINGVFDAGPREEILRQLEQAMGGEVVESAGVYYILPGVWRTHVMDLDENDLRGEVQMNTHVSLSDRFNCVRGTYVSPADKWNVTDFPPVINPTYIAEDGRKLFMDLALNFVTDPYQAQRIGKIELEKVRQGITLNWPGKVSCFFARIGENVRVNYTRFGFTNKYFRIDDLDFVVDSNGVLGVDLVLRETAPAVFDWNNGMATEVDIAPNTELPSPFNVGTVTNLQLFSGTSELYLKGDGTVVSRLRVQWTSTIDSYTVTNGGFEVQFKRSDATEWTTAAVVSGSVNFVHITDVQDLVSYDVRVRAFNSLNVRSAFAQELNHVVIGKTEPPSSVSNFNAGLNEFGFTFNWDQIPDLDRAEYEIRLGESFAEGVFVWRGRGTTTRWEFKQAGTYRFWIKAIDTSGNYSATATEAIVQIEGPGQATLSFELSGPNAVFRWNAQPGPFIIDSFLLSYGPSYAGSTQLVRVNGNSFVHRVDWGGVRTFWVAAVDIAGNIGLPGQVTITIQPPNPIRSFSTRVTQQTVMMDWLEPLPSSLPIESYDILKGDTYELSVKIGNKPGTFGTYVENFGGTFTYHVVPIDTAGNQGEPRNAQARVEEPDNFYIKEDNNLLVEEAATLTTAVAVPREPYRTQYDIYLPIDTTVPVESLPRLINPILDAGVESFQTWWDNNGWDSLEEAIEAGFDTPFLSPTTLVPGRISWLVDYEVTFSSSFIRFEHEFENLGDLVNFSTKIRTSADGVTFTEYQGDQLFAQNFRYAEYIIEFQGTTNRSFGRVKKARAVISVERKTEYILVNCLAVNDAAGGTPFSFTRNFLDIEDIQATAWGNSLGIPVINFEDDPNPNGGRVLFYDKDGNPIDGVVRVQVTGAVNP